MLHCCIYFKDSHCPAQEIGPQKYAKKAGVRRWDLGNVPLYNALSCTLLQNIYMPHDNLYCNNCDAFKINIGSLYMSIIVPWLMQCQIQLIAKFQLFEQTL